MFVGAGVGLAAGRPDVGGAIGMGVGFLLMAFIRTRIEQVEVTLPSRLSGYFLILLGITLIVGGISVIYFPHLIYPYLIGAFITLLGVGFVVLGNKAIRRHD